VKRLLWLATCLATVTCSHKTSVTTPANHLGWIHAKDGLYDDVGRQWLLRGVNARIAGLFDVSFTDGRQPLEPIPDFTQDDARQMADDGFNMLRLPINWSGLEPTEGQFSADYLARLHQVVTWCQQAGLYVLIDFHEDAYSKETGEDGAPLWAVEPPPNPLVGGPLNDLGTRRQSAETREAFQSFFTNKDGLEDRFLPAWSRVVTEFAGAPHVIGFEVMNEPVTFQFDHDGTLLQAFYAKTANALRAIDHQHALWMEPDSGRNLTLSAPMLATPFPDANIVYAPHMYPALVSVPDNSVDGWKNALAASFDGILDEAASWGATPVLDEWGQNPADPGGLPYVYAVQALNEERLLGSAFWLWKEESQGSWGFFDHGAADDKWTLRDAGLHAISTPYALAVPGKLLTHRFDAARSTLSVRFQAAGGEGSPLFYLPRSWFPKGARATLNGAALSVDVTPQRVPLPWDGAAGTFDLELTAR
jgi:endoglycosylceramidase